MIGYEGFESVAAGSIGIGQPLATSDELTVPAAATGAVIFFDTGDDAGPEPPGSVVTLGYEDCELVAFDTSGGAVTSGGSIYWCPDIRGRTDDYIRWTSAEHGSATARVLYFSANVPLLRDENYYTSSYSSGNQHRYQSSDASVPVPGANQLAFITRYQYSGTSSASAGSTLLAGGWTKGFAYQLGAADEAVDAGIYMSGGSFWGWYLGATIYESVVIRNVAPDPIVMPLALNPGAVAFQGAQRFYGSPMRAWELRLRPGRLGAAAKRQVALVGPDAATFRHTPEMTVGGNEGDLLTQHATRPSSWERPRRWVPMVYRPDPVGAPNEWEMLHADDGTPMMTWVEVED